MRILAVTNMYPTPANIAQGTFVEQQIQGLRGVGVEVDVLFLDRRRSGPGVYLGLAGGIRSRLRSFDADIVHIMYGGVMADLATRTLSERPTVVTFHGSDLLGEQSSGAFRRVCARAGVMSSWKAARRATGIVVVAKALCDAMPPDIDPAKVRIIPCGIDLMRFKPMDQLTCRQHLNWKDGRFHVLFNSNGDDPVKRPALAYAAVDALNRLGVRAEIHELRGLANSEVPVALNGSDVLLLTSRHEGSPTIVKEALACGLPVVSVDVGDVRQQISGIDGCFLASPDPTDLAAKLQLVHARDRRVQAQSRVEELSIGRIASRLKEFYEELSRVRDDNYGPVATWHSRRAF